MPDLSRTLPILLAGGSSARLHELSDLGAKPALPLGDGRLADFAMAGVAAAGLPRLLALLGDRPAALARHLPARWGDRLDLALVEGPRHAGGPGTLGALAAACDAIEAAAPDVVLLLPSDQVQALDLRALLAAHREAGAAATVAARDALRGPVAIGWPALHAALDGGGDLWADLLPRLAARGDLATWTPPAGTYWRDVDTLDDLREVALDLQRGLAPPLPPDDAGPLAPDSRDLVFEVAGIALSVPRFGARSPGRWTMLEDSAVLPGARVAPGARLTRALVAPGAIVPAGLVVGEDPEEDARWFRVTPRGTTLLTPPMLAARAAARMRARLQDRTPGLAITSGPR
ncbi:sugar phosphate nucleotidyltransferase [Rubellimicrobium aerolatum]|uniref:Sugar phosphate nucleotidyltransferase n=1 Tax=Rubellimicrobium aerolatum TaxID=490979 RepID=A0ABW0SFX5_9RHOB|nr:sugar phosphate nucleotidyltransferase [Rubellimicrobium aerolatum]MBP1806408.1 glucose-1-phosphate adenylyltransferase [Rubellimicrobium aerolatum]